MNEKYPALRTISLISIIFGWIIFVLGGIYTLFTMRTGSFGFGYFGLPMLILCVFVGLVLIACGELIRLMIDIEFNTRNSNYLNSNSQLSNKSKITNPVSNAIKNANCPKCNAELNLLDRECPKCEILFSTESYYKPISKTLSTESSKQNTIKREQPKNPNAKCPVCNSLVKQTDYDCWSCHALFTADSMYKPKPM